jgi:heme-degrading monooxygenase HmoA
MSAKEKGALLLEVWAKMRNEVEDDEGFRRFERLPTADTTTIYGATLLKNSQTLRLALETCLL